MICFSPFGWYFLSFGLYVLPGGWYFLSIVWNCLSSGWYFSICSHYFLSMFAFPPYFLRMPIFSQYIIDMSLFSPHSPPEFLRDFSDLSNFSCFRFCFGVCFEILSAMSYPNRLSKRFFVSFLFFCNFLWFGLFSRPGEWFGTIWNRYLVILTFFCKMDFWRELRVKSFPVSQRLFALLRGHFLSTWARFPLLWVVFLAFGWYFSILWVTFSL